MTDRRAPPPASRPKTAQEALEEARRAEAAKKQAEAEAEQKRELAKRLAEEARARMETDRARQQVEAQRRRAQEAVREAKRAREEDREAEAQAARDRALVKGPGSRGVAGAKTGPVEAPIAEGRVKAILQRLADDIEILEVFTDIRPDILAVLWQAHVKRARQEHDLPTLALALSLAARFEQKPAAMLAARVAWGGREWAVWVDVERKEVLAALAPADRFLTGL